MGTRRGDFRDCQLLSIYTDGTEAEGSFAVRSATVRLRHRMDCQRFFYYELRRRTEIGAAVFAMENRAEESAGRVCDYQRILSQPDRIDFRHPAHPVRPAPIQGIHCRFFYSLSHDLLRNAPPLDGPNRSFVEDDRRVGVAAAAIHGPSLSGLFMAFFAGPQK